MTPSNVCFLQPFLYWNTWVIGWTGPTPSASWGSHVLDVGSMPQV